MSKGKLLLILALALAPATALAKPKPHPGPHKPVKDVRVVDGDTVVIGGKHIRLLGVDAGETIKGRYKCAAERDQGMRAKARAEELLDTSKHEVAVVGSKGKGHLDKYGRTLASVTSDGVDVGQTLVSEGLAQPWDGHGPRPNFCK